MTSPTVTALCGIVVVLVGCSAVESVTTGGQLWLYGAGLDGKCLKAAKTTTIDNVARVSTCAFHCARLGEVCAFFFHSELQSKCMLCKADRCDKVALKNGGNYRFFSKMTWSTCPLSRGYSYYSDTNLCVRYCSCSLWWINAVKNCAMDGGHLMYINSQAEHERMKQFINDSMIYERDVKGKDVTRPFYRRLWLGAERSATTGEWIWGDGSSADAILGDKWSSGQPTAKSYLAISITDGFSMVADAGSDERHFLCEIDVMQ